MTAAQRFLTLDPDTLTADQLAALAEHWLLDMVPCEFCSAWVDRRHEWHYYRYGGIEVCDQCLDQINGGTHPLQKSGKDETPDAAEPDRQ